MSTADLCQIPESFHEADERRAKANRLRFAASRVFAGTVDEYKAALAVVAQEREMQAAIAEMEQEKNLAVEADHELSQPLRDELNQPKLAAGRRIEVRVQLERLTAALEEKLASIDERIRAATDELQHLMLSGSGALSMIEGAYCRQKDFAAKRAYEKLGELLNAIQPRAEAMADKAQRSVDSRKANGTDPRAFYMYAPLDELERNLSVANQVASTVRKWRREIDTAERALHTDRIAELRRLAAEE